MSYEIGIFGITAVVSGLATYWYYKLRRKWVKVEIVSKLYVYPVKSTSPVEVEKLFCTKYGASASKASGFDRFDYFRFEFSLTRIKLKIFATA